MTNGPAVITEPRVLAVSTRHPLARRASVCLEDLASVRIFLPGGSPPEQWLRSAQPWTTPDGQPIERGAGVGTFQEMLTLIAAGQGVCTVAAHNVRYHPRSDVAYLPFTDAPPFTFGLVWRTAAETARVRAFTEATSHLVDRWGGPTALASR
jgi:DNA-binding transcriptional LysR family regulator